MSVKNNGGPAFPIPGLQDDADFNGMSLRDYFAAKALQAAINHRGFATVEDNRALDAKDAYAYADAMIRARDA